MENQCCNDQCAGSTPRYIGVRRRKWGKWVSEIREPGKKSRIWLGSYAKAEMAAAAYDVAALHLKGSKARLNFPELADNLPKPASNGAEDVQAAAQEAAMQLMRGDLARERLDGSQEKCNGEVPIQVGLSPTEIQAINEIPLDSPRAWMDLDAVSFFVGGFDETSCGEISGIHQEWDEVDYYSIWE